MADIEEHVTDKTARDQINENVVNIVTDESLRPDSSNRTSADNKLQNMTPQSENSKLNREDIKVVASDSTKEPAAPELKDYSSFGPWQKKWIVLAATMGAFYSPFSAQIYFPALTSIAQDLHVSNSKVNLTMTTYMVCSPFPALILRLPERVTMGTRLICDIDIASYRSGIHWWILRYGREKTSLRDLFYYLYHCGYCVGVAE